MKKIIVLIMACLMLTSCTNTGVISHDLELMKDDLVTVDYSEGKSLCINDEMKETIDEINNLKEKYKDSLDDNEFRHIYINIYEDDNFGNIQDSFFINNMEDGYTKESVNDVVEILDKREAVGLKDYVKKAYEKNIGPDDYFIKKIGKSVVYVTNRNRYKSNSITIRTKLADIKDEDYRRIFEGISRDKYILDNVYTQGKLYGLDPNPLDRDLISFVNDELFMDNDISKFIKVRYEILLKDKNIDKVNILLSRKRDEKLKKEDIEVFVNLLNALDLKKEDRGEFLKAYRNVFKEKIDGGKLDIEGYSVYVKNNKGNNYIGEKKENLYISIEKE